MKRKATVGVIGCGNMGEAILAQSKKARIFDFIGFEKDPYRAKFIHRKYQIPVEKDIRTLVLKSDILLIAVKPQDIDPVLLDIARVFEQKKKSGALVVSIAAGIKTRYIEDKIGQQARVIRAMPNLPAVIGKGITALVAGRYAKTVHLKIADSLFRSVGETLSITAENMIDAVTAISGSGPAYIFFIVQIIAAAGFKMGLDKRSTNRLIHHTVLGAMDLLKENVYDTEALIARVTSKGGTTEAAFKVFEREGLHAIILDGIVAAYNRAKELSK